MTQGPEELLIKLIPKQSLSSLPSNTCARDTWIKLLDLRRPDSQPEVKLLEAEFPVATSCLSEPGGRELYHQVQLQARKDQGAWDQGHLTSRSSRQWQSLVTRRRRARQAAPEPLAPGRLSCEVT